MFHLSFSQWVFLGAVIAGLSPIAVMANEKPPPLKTVKFLDHKNFVLENGKIIRLAGIDIPPLPQAKERVESLLLNKRVMLPRRKEVFDRYGRLTAQIRTEDSVWVQGELLRAGWAYVHTVPGEEREAGQMLLLEKQARSAKRGIWADRDFRILTPEEAQSAMDRYAIIEGKVTDVAVRKNAAYINFGGDWKSDFTATIDRFHLRRFKNIDSLKGKALRVRGIVYSRNGPMIDLTHPEQMEMVKY